MEQHVKIDLAAQGWCVSCALPFAVVLWLSWGTQLQTILNIVETRMSMSPSCRPFEHCRDEDVNEGGENVPACQFIAIDCNHRGHPLAM